MLSQDWKQTLSPFKFMVSKQALNPVYRAIEIGPNVIRAVVSWGILEAIIIDTGMVSRIYVDRAAFLSVVQSLPPQKEFTLKLDSNTLVWKCGNARGKLPVMPDQEMPDIVWPKEMYPYPDALCKALALGSISCHTSSLQAIGMYGICICNDEGYVSVSSTDNVSLSTGIVQYADPLLCIGPISTLPPDGVNLLVDVMNLDGWLGSDSISWYYADTVYNVKITQVPNLKSDMKVVRNKYSQADIVVSIPREAINRFVRRANALSEAKQNAFVGLSVKGGKLLLTFKENATSTDETFEAEQLAGAPDLPELLLSASKVGRALAHVTEIVLDHIERGILLFRGHEPAFEYLLCGKMASKE